MFVKKFKDQPFVYTWDSGYSCYDPILPHHEYDKIRTQYYKKQPFEISDALRQELYHNLCFYMCLEFMSQTQFTSESQSYVLNDFLEQVDVKDVLFSRLKYSLRKRVKDIIKRYNDVKSDPERSKYYLPEKNLKPKETVGVDIGRWKKFTHLTGKDVTKYCDFVSEINNELEIMGSDFRVSEEFYSEL